MKALRRPWPYRIDSASSRVDWALVKKALAADDFDNGRSPAALRRSFEHSAHVAYAWSEEELVGLGRCLSDGVCNAYMVDIWTHSAHRRRGVGSALVGYLAARVPGQHIGLQSEEENLSFYAALGFVPQPSFLAKIEGEWLANEGNA